MTSALSDVFDAQAKVLLGSRCDRCAIVHSPPRNGCPDCFYEQSSLVPLSRRGSIRSFTTVNIASSGLPPSYTLVEVELPEGIVVLGRFDAAQTDRLRIGLAVSVEIGPIREDEPDRPIIGYFFTPADAV